MVEERMPVFGVIDSVPYTPKRRPSSPVYTDPLGSRPNNEAGGGGGILIPDTYQQVQDNKQHLPKFEIYQDKHVYEAVYEELKPVVAAGKLSVSEPSPDSCELTFKQ